MTTLEIQKVDLASFCYLNKERYPFLLESVNHNENNRYSILFAFPEENIVLRTCFGPFIVLVEDMHVGLEMTDGLSLQWSVKQSNLLTTNRAVDVQYMARFQFW